MNRAALLPGLADAWGDRAAIVETRGGRRTVITFREFAARTARLGAGLQRLGIGRGDRVLVFVPMSIDLYLVIMACLHIGAVAVFVDAWADRRRLDRAVALAAPRAFIGSLGAQLLRLVSPAIRGIPLHLAAGFLRPLRRLEAGDVRPPVPAGPDDPALITLTTGSTGRPRAAVRSHGLLAAQSEALRREFPVAAGTIDLPSLPVFVLQNMTNGVCSILPDFDPRRPAAIRADVIYRQIVGEGVQVASGSPAFFAALAAWCEPRGLTLPLDTVYTGGAPVLPPLAARLRRAVRGRVVVVYGSTEAEPIAHVDAEELMQAADDGDGVCAGVPRTVDLRLIRPDAGPVVLDGRGWAPWEVAAGEVGEIAVAGAHVGRGYLDDPEADRAVKIPDGDMVWHRTGDAGQLDARGRLRLMGRVGARVLRAGRTWWPMPAEARALSVEGVAFAVYLGVPDAALGQRAILCVEPAAGGLAATGRDALHRALAPYPVDALREFARIPRDPRHEGKPDLARLLPMLEPA